MEMKKGKLLGYNVSSKHADAGSREYQDHDEGESNYQFYILLDGKYYYFNASSSYGSCGSGWCGANWADLEYNLYETTEPLLVREAKKDTYVNIVDNKVVKSIVDSGKIWDSATVESINTTEDVLLVSSTGNGGCDYYPSGVLNINESLFK